jgi:hypothetical protein
VRPVPHPHRCLCGKTWDCANPHCTDIEQQWCKLPGCQRPEVLKRIGDLETGGHMIHQVAHYLDTQGEYTLSVALMELRDRLLVRIQQIAEEAFSAPQA